MTFPDDLIVSSAHEAHCLLVADAGDGTAMPGSRYGRHIDDATDTIYAAAVILAGETEGDPVSWRDLTYMAGLVVNDSPDPAYVIRDRGSLYGFDPARFDLGEDEDACDEID